MDFVLIEQKAYTELKNRLSRLSVAVADFKQKTAPATPEKRLDAQQVCQLLDVSKRTLQIYRENGTLPYSTIGGKYYYLEADIARILEQRKNQQ